ncbi:hypothetical protein ASD15_13735 [Massilia sp. Root351]|uniref:hypothetical protein n=1 Tax=Massilia sp. Root351 TaxID=1736522 RepID=UPI000709F25A|nr:hypothetical protein [Massilia sp. Root351]KQV80944.1 hypothetical protein ASD15_13735 [Massilia sp. Root351]
MNIPFHYQAALALIGVSALWAVLAPVYAAAHTWLRNGDVASGSATVAEAATGKKGRPAACSAIVIAVPACVWLNLSLALHALNLLAVGLAICCGAVLVYRAFKWYPRWLGVPVGVLSALGWLLVVGMLILDGLFGGGSPRTAHIGNGRHCELREYGFVTSDQGSITRVYQRHFFIDRQIGKFVISYIYPGAPGPAPDLQQRCERALMAEQRRQALN